MNAALFESTRDQIIHGNRVHGNSSSMLVPLALQINSSK